MKSGIPQSSVLGPLLFSIFVNNLPTILQSDCLLFADECKIFRPLVDDDSIDQLQNDLNRLQSWSLLWQLPFNISKCQVPHLGRANPNHTYYINSEPLQNVNEEKDLGVIIDNQLKFHSHVSSVVSKASKLLAVIRQSFSLLDTETFPYLYKSIIRIW